MNIQRLNAVLSLDSPFQEQKASAPTAEGPSFNEILNQAITRVEQDSVSASEAVVKLATGEITDVAQVMIASERANLSLGLAVQVRNKLLEAYQEIMRMPI